MTLEQIMRVMISQPIEGTVEEQARAKAKVIAELEAEGHEVWGEPSQQVPAPKGVNEALWQLGRRLQDMAGADAVYFMDGWEKDRVCRCLYKTATQFGILIKENRICISKAIRCSLVYMSKYILICKRKISYITSIYLLGISMVFFLQSLYFFFKFCNLSMK